MHPRLSASVVLLRPAKCNGISKFQVLMAQRSSTMNSFSSMFVFPGGVHEDKDEQDAIPFIKDRDAVSKITGLRELFEEAGVLLVPNRNDPNMSHAVRLDSENNVKWQHLVHENASNFAPLLKHLNAVPAVSSLHYWVTFTTPVIEKRRFTTNFFVAFVDDANISIDGGETVKYTWIDPHEALALNSKGDLQMMPPQFFVLNTLKEFKSVNEVIAASRSMSRRLPIQPQAVGVTEYQEMSLAYPGDEEHPEYPGKNGDRRRIHCKLPLGRGGYRWESNLSSEPSETNYSRM